MRLSTDESIHLEPTLVKVLRLLAFIFGLTLSVLLVLTASTGIGGNTSHPTVAYACAILFAIISILHVAWNPFTIRKVAFYYIVFSLTGAIASAFSFGFETSPIYLAWTTVFLAAYIFFGIRAILIYFAFLASGLLWLALNISRLTSENVTIFFFSLLTVGFLFVLLVYVWKLAEAREKHLEESRETEQFEHRRLAGLVNSILDSVIAVDEKGIIQLYNAATLGLFDTNQSLQGTSINALLDLVDGQNKQVDIVELAHRSKASNATYTNFSHRFTDGDAIALSIKIAPISLNQLEKGLGGFSFIFSDITKAKSLEDEKDEFISVVSHELRTPITIAEGAVSNMALTASQNQAGEAITKGLAKTHDQIMYLAEMINNLSTLSETALDASSEYTDVNLDSFTQSLHQRYATQAKDAGLTLSLDITNPIGELHTNQQHLKEILQNFITNGIKYTRSGSVTLHAKRVDGGVYFAVSDTGHGINKTDQSKIFNKFYRSEDYRIRETGGTGLGLFVAKKLCEKLGAQIKLESHLNQGSTFSFVLPDKQPALAGSPIPAALQPAQPAQS